MPILTPEQQKNNRVYNELYRFAQDIKASAVEMLHACNVARGKPAEGVTMRPEVFELSQKIGEALQDGFPEERLIEMIEDMDDEENPEEVLEDELEFHDISEEEKEMIRGVLREKKPGKLAVYNKSTGEEMSSIIIEKGVGDDRATLMYRILGLIGGREGEDIEVRFTELE